MVCESSYEREETKDGVGVSPQLVVSGTTKINKLLKSRSWSVSVVNHVRHVSRQYERNPVPAYGRMRE